MNKKTIISHIIKQLEQELAECVLAANNAHLAATDDQSVAETQYDTLAIEAAYLAEGQTKRAAEIKQAITAYQRLVIKPLSNDCAIKLGALVQVANDQSQQHWFFIGPAAGGYRTQISTKEGQQQVTVITPSSPMAKVLIGKHVNDEVELVIGDNRLIDDIIAIS